MNKPEITVLCGGVSSEREISLVSGESVASALSELFPRRVHLVDLKEEALPGTLQPEETVVFPVFHGYFGEDGKLQELLEERRFCYAGSDSTSSRLCINKEEARNRVFEDQVRVAPGITYSPNDKIDYDDMLQELGDELVIKPVAEGSSIGLSFVSGKKELISRLEKCTSGLWLVERFIPGREITVGILNGKAMGLVEVVPSGGVYDYQHKYTQGMTSYEYPANVSPDLTREITQLGQKVFHLCGCRDFARADFILGDDGHVYFLELNTIPGLTPTSLYPKSAECVGMTFQDLVQAMITPALSRYNNLMHGLT